MSCPDVLPCCLTCNGNAVPVPNYKSAPATACGLAAGTSPAHRYHTALQPRPHGRSAAARRLPPALRLPIAKPPAPRPLTFGRLPHTNDPALRRSRLSPPPPRPQPWSSSSYASALPVATAMASRMAMAQSQHSSTLPAWAAQRNNEHGVKQTHAQNPRPECRLQRVAHFRAKCHNMPLPAAPSPLAASAHPPALPPTWNMSFLPRTLLSQPEPLAGASVMWKRGALPASKAQRASARQSSGRTSSARGNQRR